MQTVFLDIDGTLLRTEGAGLRAILEVMSQRYRVSSLPEVTVHGRTDFGIWQDIFHGLALDCPGPEDIADLIEDYCDRLERHLEQKPGILLPGVERFLKAIAADERFAVGILTGNAKRAATIKLRQFEIAGYVEPFGGYGDLYADRNSVAKMAQESAHSFLTQRFKKSSVWVVGDTVNDIQCARSIGARVLAVGTGGTSLAELESAAPDALLKDLSDYQQAIDILNG